LGEPGTFGPVQPADCILFFRNRAAPNEDGLPGSEGRSSRLIAALYARRRLGMAREVDWTVTTPPRLSPDPRRSSVGLDNRDPCVHLRLRGRPAREDSTACCPNLRAGREEHVETPQERRDQREVRILNNAARSH